MLTTYHLLDFPGGSDGKESTWIVGDPGSMSELERFPGEGKGNPLQFSCLRVLWTEEPGGLQDMGLQRVRHGHTLLLTNF